MNKMTLIISTLIFFVTTGFASADYYFEDYIGTWGSSGVLQIVEGNIYNYTHDLNQEVNFAAGDFITQALLQLSFVNDSSDRQLTLGDDGLEYVNVFFNYNVATGWALGEIDNGLYEKGIDIGWLNDDGKLDIQLSVGNTWVNPADIDLDFSKVYGFASPAAVQEFTPVPTPEPATFLLLGAGFVGLTGYRRFTKK